AQVGRPSKIFYVNLFSDPVDVRLGDGENYVFEGEALEPNSVTYYVETTDFGDYTLYFKMTSEDEWIEWTDDDGYLYDCPVNPGELHAIIIGPDGTVDYYSLTADRNRGAKISFINGSDAQLSKMEVGVEFDDNDVAYIEDFDSMEISNFVSASPGVYSLFWQFPSQMVNEEHFFYPDDGGDDYERFDFDEGRYYIFLVYTVSRNDYAVLYDITPDY
ncbi:hypothetical protein LCGC14_2281310, partial [marine sediment metagenome]